MAKKRRTAAQKRATKKMIAANRRKRRGGKRRRRAAKAEAAPKRRRRRRKAKAAAAPKRRRRRRRSKRRSSRRRGGRRAVKTVRQRVVSVPKAGTQSVRIDLAASRGGKRRRSRRRRKNPETRLANPPVTGAGLLSNQGPFTRDALMGYVAAAGGVGLGVIGADFLDRFVATRTPTNGTHPWYGRAAAAAYNRRPDAMRLGVQAGGAVAAMALTYFARNMRVFPWALGGLSVGFGVNLLKMLSDWYLMPAIMKVDNVQEISFQNRMFPMEQAVIQDEVDRLFENYTTTPGLAIGQPASGDPVVNGPIGLPLSVYALGDGKPGAGEVGRPANGRRFINTGKLGGCSGCGGNGGCWSDCPNMCNECIANGGDGTAVYEVEPGDNYTQIVQAAGVDAAIVSGLNGGKHFQEFWRPRSRVTVPYALGVYLQQAMKHRAALAGVPQAHAPMPVPQPVPQPVIQQSAPDPVQGNGNGHHEPVKSASGLFNDAE